MKESLEVITGLKDKNYLAEYARTIVPQIKVPQEKVEFERWISLINLVNDKGKKYYNGQNEAEIITVLRKIDSDFMKNPIVKQYYKTGDKELWEEIEKIVNKVYLENVKVASLEEQSVTKEESKTYVKATNKKIGTETGFASPLLLALLTATIEISTIAYIILNAMD